MNEKFLSLHFFCHSVFETEKKFKDFLKAKVTIHIKSKLSTSVLILEMERDEYC